MHQVALNQRRGTGEKRVGIALRLSMVLMIQRGKQTGDGGTGVDSDRIETKMEHRNGWVVAGWWPQEKTGRYALSEACWVEEVWTTIAWHTEKWEEGCSRRRGETNPRKQITELIPRSPYKSLRGAKSRPLDGRAVDWRKK